MTPLLQATGIALRDRLAPTDLAVDAGALVAVIGSNGSGKTSLLRALACIDESSGVVSVDGEAIRALSPGRRPHIVTYAPASRELAWPIAARDAIALGLPKPDPERIDDLIDLLELGTLSHRPVNQLSTGERARVLFARALAPRPRLLLLDEPLSNLDPYWVLRTLEILRNVVAAGATALVALHDIDRLPAFDRSLLMDGGAMRADLEPAEMLRSDEMSDAFRLERGANGWSVRPPVDRRSSP